MSNVIEQLYTGLLADPTAAPSLQRRVFTFAKQRKAYRLLSVLAAHPALLPDLDAALGSFNDAKVRSAWALRSNRTQGELEELACKDPRAAVITDLAGRQDLSDEAYRQMARRGHQKVDWVLLSNPRVALDVRQDIARRLGAALSSSSWRTQGKISAALDDQPELHDAFASESTNPSVLKVAAGTPGLSVKTQVHMANLIVAGAQSAVKAKSTTRHGYWGHEYNNLHTLGDVLARLSTNPDFAPEAAKVLQQLGSLKTEHHTFDDHVKVALSRTASGGTGPGGVNPLTDARTTTDQDDLVRYAGDVVRNRDGALATAVASNPAAGAELMAQVCEYVPHTAQMRIVRTRRGDVDAIVALLAGRAYWVDDDTLVASGEPERVLRGLARSFAGLHRSLPVNLLNSRFVTPSLAEDLPVSVLSMADVPVLVSQATTAAIEATFGRSVTHWEIFETLGDTFSGTLRELLDGVIAIAGDVDPSELEAAESLPVVSEPVSESDDTVSEPVSEEPSEAAEVPAEESAGEDVPVPAEKSAGSVCNCRTRGHSGRRVQLVPQSEQLVFPV